MNLAPDRIPVAKLGIACAALLAAAIVAPPAHAEEWTKSYSVSGRAQVRVETNDGSVNVSTSDSKQVEFLVDYEGFELNKNLHVDSRQDGDSVQLNARTMGHWGFSWGKGRRIRIEVRMPKDADLQIDTGDGSVNTQSITGRLKIHTGDGSVRAQAVSGDVDIDTGDGSITLEGAKGDIRLRTGDGHIDARDLDGKVDATSGDGHIKLAGRLDALNIKTGDGGIDARLQPGSKIASSWSIRTGDGSVDIVLPADLQANIDASTSDGHISLGIPVTVEGTFSNSQIHGKMNGGGQSLTIHTGDGSIRLSKT
jgi:putative adhesin